MMKNLVFYAKTKYIEICHHFIIEPIENHIIKLEFISTTDIHIFTKSLATKKFEALINNVGITN